jgi:5-methylcytosine-specific restriction endonuclease McrA
MKNSAKKKNKQLGMNFSTASHRLKKQVMFELIKETKKDSCYRCGQKITTAEVLSIDHKVDWLDSTNPISTFWDLNNIGFSHKHCNTAAGNKNKTYTGVTKLKNVKKPYQARHWNGKQQIFIGYFSTREEAEEAVKKMAS